MPSPHYLKAGAATGFSAMRHADISILWMLHYLISVTIVYLCYNL